MNDSLPAPPISMWVVPGAVSAMTHSPPDISGKPPGKVTNDPAPTANVMAMAWWSSLSHCIATVIDRFSNAKQLNPTRHEDFSPRAVPRLCVTIGHQLNEFNSFYWLRYESIYRFEHIVTYSSGKVVAKSLRHNCAQERARQASVTMAGGTVNVRILLLVILGHH